MVTFNPGDEVMVLDKTRKSKWDPAYEGSYTVIRKTRGGSYILKDKEEKELKTRFPPSLLKKIIKSISNTDEQSYEIKQITNHRKVENGYEYLVHWKIASLDPKWLPETQFDNNISIRKYWKSLKKKSKKKGSTKRQPSRIRTTLERVMWWFSHS